MQDEKSFKFRPYEIRVYIIDYKKKEHHHRHSQVKKKSTTDKSSDFPILSTESTKASLTKKQQAALKKLEDISKQSNENQTAMIQALAAATTKALSETEPLSSLKTKAVSETTASDQEIPADSAEIDLENEPIQNKRERQRSIVLNLGRKILEYRSRFHILFN